MELLSPRQFWLLIAVLFFASPAAHATEWNVYRDYGGLPRCVADKNTWYKGWYFHWDDSKQYLRKLYAIPLKAFRSQEYPVHCSNWDQFSATAANSANFFLNETTELAPTQQVADIPTDVRAQLELARQGAYFPWDVATFAYYVNEARANDYTLALNKKMTDTHGIFFATEVFRSWLRGKPKNRKLESRILGHLDAIQKRRAKQIAKRMQGYRVIVARGYFEAPNNSRVQQFIDELNTLGISTSAFAVNTTESVTVNAMSIRDQLERELDNGAKLIVAGASKGSAELYGALASLHVKRPEFFRPGGARGHVAAVLSISGTLRGSFIVDWALGAIPYLIVRWSMLDEARRTGVDLREVRPGLESQGSYFLHRYFQQHAPLLPQEIPFFDVAGVPSIETMQKEGFVKDLREGLLDTGFFPRHRANDGMLEFPNMVTPDEWARENYQIVMDSSHTIFDGAYNQTAMYHPESSRKVLDAIFQSIMDRIEGKF